MAWLQVHQSLKEHRKTLRLADLLDVPLAQAAGHVLFLWLWSLDSAPDGRLCDMTARNLSRAADWMGEPEHFVTSLITVGFLDKGQDGALAIHDFEEYVGNLMERRAVNAERQKRFRDTEKQRRNASRNANVATEPSVTSRGREEKSRAEKSREDTLAVADAPAVSPKPKVSQKAETPKPYVYLEQAEALAEVCEIPFEDGKPQGFTKAEERSFWAAVGMLGKAGRSGDDIRDAGQRYWAGKTRTPMAFANHISDLLRNVGPCKANGGCKRHDYTPQWTGPNNPESWRVSPDGPLNPGAPDDILSKFGPMWGVAQND